MNRVDLAQTKLKQLKTEGAEEHTLTRLASCWVTVTEGDKAKLQEASYTYEELIDKYSKLAVTVAAAMWRGVMVCGVIRCMMRV